MTFPGLLKNLCFLGFQKAFPHSPDLLSSEDLEITEATQPQYGHYQLNTALKLSKVLPEKPRVLAEKWVEGIQALSETPSRIARLEVAGPGFINITLQTELIVQTLEAQLHDPGLGVEKPLRPYKVVIDFSSPNIAKEMHVGHLRSTIIGDSLARILTFLGHEVLPLNHLGDWGTQFGMLIAHIKTVCPLLTGDHPPAVELPTLVSWYKESKKRFDEDPHFKKSAQQEVVALQRGEETSKRVWEHLCAISREAYQTIYDLLDIKIIERGESFYNPLLAPLIEELTQKGYVTVSEGARCIELEGFTNRAGEKLPLILQKSDGGYNYATTDMAALRHRIEVEKADWIIIVTDAGQSLHFEMLLAAAKKVGFYHPEQVRVDHVPFGMVLNAEGKKFKTRSGETERLIDLLQTAMRTAKEKLKEHNPTLSPAELESSAKILGINAIKYADLSSHRISDYVFSYEKMLKFQGNTAAFILYAFVRIQSIQRKVQWDKEALLAMPNALVLQEPSEIALALLACQFRIVLQQCSEELLPNRLTDYLYRLSEKFHVFFHECRVEGSPEQNSRLLLCEAVAQVLYQGLHLLGLKPLDRM